MEAEAVSPAIEDDRRNTDPVKETQEVETSTNQAEKETRNPEKKDAIDTEMQKCISNKENNTDIDMKDAGPSTSQEEASDDFLDSDWKVHLKRKESQGRKQQLDRCPIQKRAVEEELETAPRTILPLPSLHKHWECKEEPC